MNYLLWGLGVLIALYLIRRFLGDHQQAKSREYEVFEKRFRLDRRTFRSQWGKGMGSHFSLEGDFRGYPVRLYSHFHGNGRKKITWTSLTFEVLALGELEIVINIKGSGEGARFEPSQTLFSAEESPVENGDFYANEASLWSSVWNDALSARLNQLGEEGSCGSISLSKGFLEYRESGEMDTEMKRVRFQAAILFLADFSDELSLFVKKR